ncbi:MAG: N-acetylglucosamine-6-phosphate deacetylase [Acidobacteria bacterium]|nr:N-acetylglucosamine-6-phosphate deacetylase [Acidobacteriota bacterium]MBI3658696.1 N-acetylglucosamine-6-phosphate deacetylase [Acidobacteriota bacterium]
MSESPSRRRPATAGPLEKSRFTVILAGAAYTPERCLRQAAIFVANGGIAGVMECPARDTPTEPFRRKLLETFGSAAEVGKVDREAWIHADWIEAWDGIVAPGFIELHTNGIGGFDAMDPRPESLSGMARALARYGTTAFLPTVITAPKPYIMQALSTLADAMAYISDGASPLGIHLEGPFLSPCRRGTHPAAHLQPPALALFQEFFEASRGHLRVFTLAPELKGALGLIERAAGLGVIPALGHSDATYEEAQQGIEAGARHSVHLFNAMRAFNHRDPGIVGAILSDDRISAEIITDGIHVHPVAVQILVGAKRLDKIVLSTDSISAAGMADGPYKLGGKRVVVINGACRDDEGRLAGSSLTQDRALRNLMAWTGISPADALATATLNPACVLGLNNKGRIREGADADLVILSRQWEVERTFVQGRTVFQKPE